MSQFSIPLTRLIHENLSIVMCFAFSQRPLAKMVDVKFVGEWKYLNRALFDISAARAEKACLELAIFLRMLDDEHKISAYHAQVGIPGCGRLVMKDKSEKVLTFREVANKVIHSSRLEWQFSDDDHPLLICHTREKEKWLCAEVDIVAFAAVCGQLTS
jgi:hypothetical protein